MRGSKPNWFLGILGLAIALLAIMAGALGWDIQQIIVSVLFFFGGAYCANESTWRYKIGIIILPFLLLYGVTAIYSKAYHVLPVLLSCPVSVIIGGRFYSYSSVKYRIKGLLILIFFILFCQTFVFPNWIVLTLNKPQLNATPLPRFALLKENRDTIWSDSWKGNIVLLDFWSTACAPCIKKFPDLEKVKKAYSGHKNVKVYSVNLPLKRDDSQRLENILDTYTFETLYALDRDSLKNRLKIEKIPYVILIDSNGIIRYRGGLYTDWNVFIGNVYSEIDGLLTYRNPVL